jgi:hypothetical protein
MGALEAMECSNSSKKARRSSRDSVIIIISASTTASLELRRAFFDEFEPGNANISLSAAPLTCLTAGKAPGDGK